MDRIRKALDLARRDRARLLIDEEPDLTGSVPEPRAAAVVTPVIAPFVAPAESPVVAAPPARVIEAPPQNPAPAPVISLASYVASAARGSASSNTQVAASRVISQASAPAAPLRERELPPPAVAEPPEVAPAAPHLAAIAQPAAVLSPPSEAVVEPAAAPERAQAAPAVPASAQPFTGVVSYTKTRVYTPAPGLLESKRIVNPARVDPAAAAFRMLRTQVLQRMEDRGWRSLAILSPNAEDGKTTTAINLAVSLAYDQRHTVLLVDCDLRRPSIAGMLGIAPEFGLDDVLTGRAEVDQMPLSSRGLRPPGHPAGARAARQLIRDALGFAGREVVSELHARYPERIVIFDLPPILGTDDALAFLPMADCALMSLRSGQPKREDLLRSMELVTRNPSSARS